MKTYKVNDRFKDVEDISIDGEGYASIVTLPKSLARKLERFDSLERELEELREDQFGVSEKEWRKTHPL